MKKKISTVFLAISASSNLLLAQPEDRLKVIGYRLEVEKTDESALLDTTTNYKLRTTNCNNQANNLECYPMMYTAKLELGEGWFEVSGKGMPTTEIASTEFHTKGIVVAVVQGVGMDEESVASFSRDLNGKAEYAKERAQEYTIKAKTAWDEKRKCWFEKSKRSKMNEACCWDEATHCSMKASNFWNKANEILAQRNQSITDLCIRTAKQYEEAVEYKHQAANVAINQDTTDYGCFDIVGRYCRNSANELEKAVIAHEKATQAIAVNQGELAALWLKTVKQHEESAEYHREAANAKIGGNTTNFDRFDKVSAYDQNSADELEQASIALEKAIQASAMNQGELAALLIKASKQHEESAEYFGQAANAALSENAVDRTRFDLAANSSSHRAKQLEEAATAWTR
ncbi:MAG TPA: hypothetical protein VJK54_09485 [Chthoniobacterales bacterium]|nr:hypothetical protein [Chthoniobacterales bacterium]